MTWINIDPQELGATGVHLRDVSAALIDSAARVRAACCAPGLGRHAGPLMAEGESLATRTISLTEGYLHLGIDILQRAIAAVRDGQLVSSVGGVGAVTAAVLGGTYVGGHSWSDGITVGGGGTMTIGGNSWSDGITVGGGGTVTLGGHSWSDGLTIGGLGTSIVGGAGSFVGGGSGMAGGAMALAGAVQKSQERQQVLMASLRASGGGGVSSGGLGNQMLTTMVNAQALQQLENSRIRTAASSPIAGYPQAQAADATDFGGRVRALDDARYFENKRLGRI